MKYCGKKELVIDDEKYIVPEIDNVRVKINQDAKDETEYYIILE